MTLWQVLSIIAGVLALQAVIWIVVLRAVRKFRARMADAMRHALADVGGERVVLPPTVGAHHAAHVWTQALIALTERRVVTINHRGERADYELAKIDAVDVRGTFETSLRVGWRYVVLRLDAGHEIGLQLRDPDVARWADALRAGLGGGTGTVVAS